MGNYMNCKSVDLFLSDCRMEEMALAKDNLMLHHMHGCKNCTDSFRQTQSYLAGLAKLASPELSASGEDRLLKPWRKKESLPENKSRYWPAFYQGFSVACACGLVLVMGLYLQSAMHPSEVVNEKTVIAKKWQAVREQNISIVIEAPSTMQQVELSLRFPESLRWSGLEETTTVTWNIDLDKGVNVLEVPVAYNQTILENDFHAISIQLRHQESSRSFQLPVALQTQLSANAIGQSGRNISL
jgi:hypothetical protein